MKKIKKNPQDKVIVLHFSFKMFVYFSQYKFSFYVGFMFTKSLEILFYFFSCFGFSFFTNMTTIRGKYKDLTTNDNKYNRIVQNWKEYFLLPMKI